MNNEIDANNFPAGLYRDPESGKEIGCLDENQAAAAVRLGYKLVPGGDPMKTQAEMDADAGIQSDSSDDSSDDSSKDSTDDQPTKKGKK